MNKSALRWIFILSLLMVFHGDVTAQVKSIKSASSGKRNGSGESGLGSNSSYFYFDLLSISIQGLVEWHKHKLQMRDTIPSLVSLEVSFHSAIQPSTYYVIHPRIRGNWGLFSTDIRLNYLVEETIEGPLHLRTTDWQIIQLNVITTPKVDGRIGAGIMHEAYNGRKIYGEWTMAFTLKPTMNRLGAGVEYRNASVRKELSGALHLSLGASGNFHWYVTIGAAFQRYYSSINVWGFQGGLILKIF